MLYKIESVDGEENWCEEEDIEDVYETKKILKICMYNFDDYSSSIIASGNLQE